jgi:hypothetical protein
VQRLKTQVSNLLVSGNNDPWSARALNRSLLGWSNYFCQGTRRAAFRGVDRYVYERLRDFLARRHNSPCQRPRSPSTPVVSTWSRVLSAASRGFRRRSLQPDIGARERTSGEILDCGRASGGGGKVSTRRVLATRATSILDCRPDHPAIAGDKIGRTGRSRRNPRILATFVGSLTEREGHHA